MITMLCSSPTWASFNINYTQTQQFIIWTLFTEVTGDSNLFTVLVYSSHLTCDTPIMHPCATVTSTMHQTCYTRYRICGTCEKSYRSARTKFLLKVDFCYDWKVYLLYIWRDIFFISFQIFTELGKYGFLNYTKSFCTPNLSNVLSQPYV